MGSLFSGRLARLGRPVVLPGLAMPPSARAKHLAAVAAKKKEAAAAKQEKQEKHQV